MILQIISTLILACLNGVAYRMGGSGNYPRWIRPVAIGILVMATIVLWCGFTWNLNHILSLLASGGASAGLSTTYFKKKGTDAHWWNWALVGAFMSLAVAPWAWAEGHWLGFWCRFVILTPAITLWSQFIGWDVLEEFGRGFFIIATIPLLAINIGG